MSQRNTVRNGEYPQLESEINGGLGNLAQAEIRLIRLTRGIDNGILKDLKVQNGIPTFGEEIIVIKTHKLV